MFKVFLNNYASLPADDPRSMAEKGEAVAKNMALHKPYLYKFIKNFQEHISDHQIWRMVWRIKTTFKEDPTEVKEAKINEINAMCKTNWSVQLDVCEVVEKSVIELIQMFDAG